MPEPTTTRRMRRGGRPAWRIEQLVSTDSTNRVLLDAARSGAPDGTVVVADHQTAGRGRRGRSWYAAPGSALLVSVLVRPDVSPPELPLVTMAAGLGLVEALASVAGVAAALKWPNDVVVDDRKLAGILAEADVTGETVQAVVVGLGVNLTAGAVPPEMADRATACELVSSRPFGRDELLGAFLDVLGRHLGDLAAVPDAYRARSATIGRHVRVDLGDGAFVTGDAVGVSDSGALLVRDGDGAVRAMTTADVVHLRDAG